MHVWINVYNLFLLFVEPLISLEAGLNGSFISNANHKLSNPKGQWYAVNDNADLNVCRIKQRKQLY